MAHQHCSERVKLCAKVKKVDVQMNILHLRMHRVDIVFYRPSKELELVMKEVTQIENFIKTRSLDNRVCSQLCRDIGSDDMHVLYHSEVRWLPRVNVLQRAFCPVYKALKLQVDTKFAYISDIITEISKFDI